MSYPKVIFIRVPTRPPDFVTRLALAGITSGPTGGPNTTPGAFWILDNGQPVKAQVEAALTVLGVTPGTPLSWTDPTPVAPKSIRQGPCA